MDGTGSDSAGFTRRRFGFRAQLGADYSRYGAVTTIVGAYSDYQISGRVDRKRMIQIWRGCSVLGTAVPRSEQSASLSNLKCLSQWPLASRKLWHGSCMFNPGAADLPARYPQSDKYQGAFMSRRDALKR